MNLLKLLCRMPLGRARPAAQRVLGATLLGALFAGTLFAVALGVRPDIRSAFETWRFVFKFILALTCMACAWWACLELARPEVRLKDVAGWIALAPALLAVAVPTNWWPYRRRIGRNRPSGNFAAHVLARDSAAVDCTARGIANRRYVRVRRGSGVCGRDRWAAGRQPVGSALRYPLPG